MGKRNTYNDEDRIIAITLYRNKKAGNGMEIGLFAMKRIAQVTGHSVASYEMKVDQLQGIECNRHKKYVEDRDFTPGLNEWAADDERMWNDWKDSDLDILNTLAKNILNNRFKTWKESRR